jgi:hypothetical protein
VKSIFITTYTFNPAISIDHPRIDLKVQFLKLASSFVALAKGLVLPGGGRDPPDAAPPAVKADKTMIAPVR